MYRPLSEEEQQQMTDLKSSADHLLGLIEAVPAGREQSLAKTKLEEAVMWAVKSITG